MVVVNESTSIQIVCDSSTLIDSTRINRNDVVGVEGEVGKTRKGELSVFATKLQLLAPCWHNFPVQQSKLDPVLKCRRRYLDLMTNVPCLCIVHVIAVRNMSKQVWRFEPITIYRNQ